MLLKEEQLPDVEIITAERSEIITGSPYKKILEEKKANKRLTESLNQGNKLLVERDVNKKRFQERMLKKVRACCQEEMLVKKLRKLKMKTYLLLADRMKKRQFVLCVLNLMKRIGYSVETVRIGSMRLVQTYQSYLIRIFVISVSFIW